MKGRRRGTLDTGSKITARELKFFFEILKVSLVAFV